MERLIPFDVIPRILNADEWKIVSTSICRRVRAVDPFLDDIYHERRILKSGRIPAEMVLNNPGFTGAVLGLDLLQHVYVHIAGIDVVARFCERLLCARGRCPGPRPAFPTCWKPKNMMKLFPELLAQHLVAPVNHYPEMLLKRRRPASVV